MSQDYKIILTALDQTRPAFEGVRRSLGDVAGMAKSAGLALAGVGAGVTLNALVGQFNKVVESAAGLKEAAERTGSTVEAMGALSRAAKLTGNDFASVEQGVIRLTRSLYSTDEESSAVARSLTSIGLSVQQLRGLDPAESFRVVAARLSEFQDSASKTAVAMALFGKNGAQLLPFMKDLIELGEVNTKITRAQAYEADQYQKNMLRLSAASSALYRSIAVELLPVVNELTGAMVEGQKSSVGLLQSFGMWVGSKITGPAAMVRQLREELEALERSRRTNAKAGWATDNLDELIARKKAQLDQAKFMEREAALKGDPAANEDPNDIRVRRARERGRIDFAPAGAQAAADREPLADSAKAYANIMNELATAQRGALMSGIELTASQRNLVAVMSSPEWLKMPEPWREMIAVQGEAVVAAEKTAAAQKRLNDLLAATPTAKLEAQRETMQFLAQAFEDGKISAEQFQEAAQAALGTLPDLARDGENAFADLQRAIEGWGRESANAIVDFTTTGKLSFSGMVSSMLRDLARMVVYKNITKPLTDAVSSKLPSFASFFGSTGGTPPPIDFFYGAKGFVAQSPSLSAYSGGIYDSPQMFKFARGAAGIFGEAGPEAIMPLQRGRDGKLGVAANGAGNVTVNVSVQATSAPQVDASGRMGQLGQAIAQAVRVELINQKRPGGLLAA